MDSCKCIVQLLTLLVVFYTHPIVSNRNVLRTNRRGLRIKDCGGDARPIQVIDLEIWPLIVRIPGKVRIWPTLNITEDLPPYMGAFISVNMLMDDGSRLPVVSNKYYKGVCDIMNAHYERYGCPKAMRQEGIPCQCPFSRGFVQFKKRNQDYPLKYYLPKLEPYVPWLIEGEFEMSVQILDETDKRELGCVQLTFFVKKRRRDTSSSNALQDLLFRT